MNRKGFTLIELVAVVFILSLILVIAAPSISNAYKNSKLKSEEIFVDKLSDVIDSYVKLNDITYNEKISGNKCNEYTYENDIERCKEGKKYSVTIDKGTIKISDIITKELLSEVDYVNAGNKDVQCKKEAEIEVYRDSDFVYCHKVNKNSLGCITDEYKNSITGDYVIDTCIWE